MGIAILCSAATMRTERLSEGVRVTHKYDLHVPLLAWTYKIVRLNISLNTIRGVRMLIRWASLLFACCFVLLAQAGIGHACSRTVSLNTICPDFQIKVTDRGSPVKGLRLVLRIDGPQGPRTKVVADAITDSEGLAKFSNLEQGGAWLSADFDPTGEETGIYVSMKDPSGTVLYMDWPSEQPIAVTSIRSGVIRKPNYEPGQVQPRVLLSLLESKHGEEIETTSTDSKGRYSFAHDVAPGIYFLKLSDPGSSSGRPDGLLGSIPIEVNSLADNQDLDIDMAMGGCGMSYSQRLPVVQMDSTKICGDIMVSGGIGMIRAHVFLLDNETDANVVDTTYSRDTFSFENKPGGNYTVVITVPGFAPYFQRVHLNSSRTSGSCPVPIHAAVSPVLR